MIRGITAAAVLLFVHVAAAAPAPFEKTPAPPAALRGVHAGMPLAEAKAQLSSFTWDASYTDAAARKRLVMDAGNGVRYYVLVTGETVARIGIEAPEKGLAAKLTKLWGAPIQVKNPANETLTSWLKAPWRVDLACRGALCRLAFHESLSTTFFGTAVAPPGALATLAPSMTRDQLAQLSPQHASGADIPAGYEDVHVRVDVTRTGVVRGVVIVGLPTNALELATTAWGAPKPSDRGAVWIGDRGWRAIYDPQLRSIELQPHVTAAHLLGAGPGIAMLARPVLGAHVDQIAAAYPTLARDKRGASLLLPGLVRDLTDLAQPQPTVVRVMLDAAQRANGLSIALPYADPKARTELVKLLATKWGKPSLKTPQILAFPTGKLRIEAKDVGGALELTLAI